MAMETPLKRAEGLGSAKEGTGHFWKQRLTAVASLLLLPPFIALIIALLGADYAQAIAPTRQRVLLPEREFELLAFQVGPAEIAIPAEIPSHAAHSARRRRCQQLGQIVRRQITIAGTGNEQPVQVIQRRPARIVERQFGLALLHDRRPEGSDTMLPAAGWVASSNPFRSSASEWPEMCAL